MPLPPAEFDHELLVNRVIANQAVVLEARTLDSQRQAAYIDGVEKANEQLVARAERAEQQAAELLLRVAELERLEPDGGLVASNRKAG